MSLPIDLVYREGVMVFYKSTHCSLLLSESSELGAMANNPSLSEKRAITEEERFPELFVNTNIDRRIFQRVVPLKVIVVGMPRTGTQCVYHPRIGNQTSPRRPANAEDSNTRCAQAARLQRYIPYGLPLRKPSRHRPLAPSLSCQIPRSG